ncbi:acyl-ACP--UDP-N-acetylglucosamine O-acyltransferase, partial [Alphaproteobacteria bacterium]|nr:acyl-ACP--UDP-N-acetylglucosamine O-acyltransferase [Alphaproteobacteria bacterium]
MTQIIHKSSDISSSVKLGKNVLIGPFCHIDGNIEISDNTQIISNSCIYGNVKIGSGNKIYPFTNIGCDPQDLKFEGEDSYLTIGNNNIIRENVTISKGTKGDNLITTIGSSNLFMTGTHVAHDCVIGNQNIFANQATLAGHVKIIDNVIIGGLSAVQQFITIGSYSMIGGMSGVDKNIMPASLVLGNRAKLRGLNLVGLRRADFSNEEIRKIKHLQKDINFINELRDDKSNKKIVD